MPTNKDKPAVNDTVDAATGEVISDTATSAPTGGAPVTANDLPHKKSVAMSWFWKTGTDEQAKGFRKAVVDGSIIVGQVIGQVFSVGSRMIDDEEKGEKESLFLQGMFEFGSDITGFKCVSATFYAPIYYCNEVQAQLKAPGIQSVTLAADIMAEASDKTPVGYSWTFIPLTERKFTDPLEQIKRDLQRRKKLRLAAPVALAQIEQAAE